MRSNKKKRIATDFKRAPFAKTPMENGRSFQYNYGIAAFALSTIVFLQRVEDRFIMRNFTKQLAGLTLFILIPLVSSFSFAAENDGKIHLTNPSFETSDENGAPSGWSASPRFFSITSEESRSGNACLRWNGDGQEYVLCTQRIDLNPGSKVDFSVWAKTKDLQGGRATVCIEWNRSDGTWYGGSYAQGVSGTTSEWTKIECRAIIPKDAVNPHCSCYVTRGGVGTAWFDDFEIVRYNPPLFSAMTTDHYRNQSIGEKVETFVGFNNFSNSDKFETLSPRLELRDADNRTVLEVTPAERGSDFFRYVFDSAQISVGSYRLVCSAQHPETNTIETISIPFSRLSQYPERKSYIDQHRRLITDGKPFFPLGLYMGSVSDSDIETISGSPFNCLMPYASISRETIDKLLERNIRTIYSVKDNFPTLNSQTMEEGDAKTRQTVETLKDCPGIIAWYINDELPASMVSDLASRRDLMEKLDPGRPTWIVLYQVEEYRDYLSTYDVAGSDPYPIPSKPASLAADWTRKTMDAGFGTRAVWQVPQIFNWASYHTPDEQAEYRAPSYEEARGMSWQCIAEGANGLIYYSFFDLQRMGASIQDGGRAVVPESFDKRWDEVKKVASEIADQFPILLSSEKPLSVTMVSDNNNIVSSRLYGTDEGTWILAVNTSDQEQTVDFSIPENTKFSDVRLGGNVSQNGSVLRVVLKALEPSLIFVK